MVMGQVDRAPTSEELEQMKGLARKAMSDGAYGMSTGLIYIPGSFAKTDEIIEVARVVGQQGGIYASHMRDEGAGLLDSIAEILRIGSEGSLPVHVSHFKASGRDAWGTLRVAAETIDKARAGGQRITADQYPYIASSTSLEATLLPAWSREGGHKELEKRLAESESRAKIRAAVEKSIARTGRIQLAACQPHPSWVGQSLEEVARERNQPVADLVLEIEAEGGARIVNFGMQEEEVRYAMQLPWVATASDGSAAVPDANQPHPRSFGTFARKVGYYAIGEKTLGLEHAVRSASGLPAEILGLEDRGRLKTGLAADVVVFDPATFRDRATYDAPYQYSTGMRYVFVGGTPAIYEGTPTGALAGRALRRGGDDDPAKPAG
jgi:N-acyl-D-aspartate/D-glutamate deacylase